MVASVITQTTANRTVDALQHKPALFAVGSASLPNDPVLLASGNQFMRGHVVAQDSVTGKIVPCVLGGANGTDTAIGVMAEYIDTSATGTNADTTAHMCNFTQSGAYTFVKQALFIDPSWGTTLATAFPALQAAAWTNALRRIATVETSTRYVTNVTIIDGQITLDFDGVLLTYLAGDQVEVEPITAAWLIREGLAA